MGEDENDISPLESDDTWQFDEQTAVYKGRAEEAIQRYREETYPEDFYPPSPAPAPDPGPDEEDEDLSPIESVKVAYYDDLSKTRQSSAVSEADRFAGDLDEFARREREAGREYEIPESEVIPFDIEDDGKDSMESDLVAAYDTESAGYGVISVAAAERFVEKNSEIASKSAKAYKALDDLKASMPDLMNSDSPGSVKASIDSFDSTINGQAQSDFEELDNAIKSILDDN